jgi:hypothetical protein
MSLILSKINNTDSLHHRIDCSHTPYFDSQFHQQNHNGEFEEEIGLSQKTSNVLVWVTTSNDGVDFIGK